MLGLALVIMIPVMKVVAAAYIQLLENSRGATAS